mgnify:CR=1 FL=1
MMVEIRRERERIREKERGNVQPLVLGDPLVGYVGMRESNPMRLDPIQRREITISLGPGTLNVQNTS